MGFRLLLLWRISEICMHAVVFTINTSSWINNGRMGRVVVLGEIEAHNYHKQTN